MPDIFGDRVLHQQCTHCGQWFPANDTWFTVNNSKPNSIATWCRECHREADRKRLANFSPEDVVKKRLKDAENRAEDKGLAFSIKLEDLYINGELPKYCSVSGIELDYKSANNTGSKYSTNPFAFSLDRIDNNLGYIPGNVRIVCWIYNSMKNQYEEDLLLYLIKQIHNTSIAKNSIECKYASMAELVDAPDLKSVDHYGREGSTPSVRIAS